MQSSADVFSLNLLVFHLTKWSSKRAACFITWVNSSPAQHREIQAHLLSSPSIPPAEQGSHFATVWEQSLHVRHTQGKRHPPRHSFLIFCDPSKTTPNKNMWLRIRSLYQHILSFICNFQRAHHHLFTLMGKEKKWPSAYSSYTGIGELRLDTFLKGLRLKSQILGFHLQNYHSIIFF